MNYFTLLNLVFGDQIYCFASLGVDVRSYSDYPLNYWLTQVSLARVDSESLNSKTLALDKGFGTGSTSLRVCLVVSKSHCIGLDHLQNKNLNCLQVFVDISL